MSEELGPVEYGENEQEVFLGRSVATQQNMSEEMARKVDLEVRKLIDEAPALIELLKAMYKQFEAKGRTGQGRANRNFDLSPAVSGNYTGSR